MGISLRKYTECSAKNKRSYQLRTGQMKLPVRKIKLAQYVDSKDSIYEELPNCPIIGNVYIHKKSLVKCIETNELSCQSCVIKNDIKCNIVKCNPIVRHDYKYVKIIIYNA